MSQEQAAAAAADVTPAQTNTAPADATQTSTETKPAGETLLTKTEGEADTAKPQEEAKDSKDAEGKQEDPAALIPEKPEDYAFTFPDGTVVDKALAGEFQKTAHKLGLNQGQAQELAALYAGHTKTAEAQQAETLRSAVNQWEGEIKALPSYKEDRTNAQRALAQYGSAELNALMDETLIGSHPAMFRFVASIGKALGEPEMKGSGTGSGAGLNFYPSMKS